MTRSISTTDSGESDEPAGSDSADPTQSPQTAVQAGPFENAGRLIERIDPQQTGVVLAELRIELNRIQRATRIMIQNRIQSLEGRSCDTLEANQELAESLQALLESQGLRLQCSECGHPAILRVSPRKGSPRGAFVFDHTINGRRTFHGGAGVVPRRLVDQSQSRDDASATMKRSSAIDGVVKDKRATRGSLS
ncbi:MAG: hypothetical protein AAGD07_26115, partial [Planctomycetota bacterium]